MVEWFKGLSEGWQILIVTLAIGGIVGFLRWLFKGLSKWKGASSKKAAGTGAGNNHPAGDIIQNLPYRSIGDLLKGRTKALRDLHKQLDTGPTAITQPVSIFGLGGVGKTRLAVEYALRSLNEGSYKAVFFISSDSIYLVNASLAALASPNLLNLSEYNMPEQEIVVKAVIDALNSRNDWLMIFDNVDNDATRQYICGDLLGKLITGHIIIIIIITSRLSGWPMAVADLPVDKLNKKDAALYLRSSTKSKRSTPKDDVEMSEVLGERLGGLPVALEQAAAYINHMRISFAEYLEEFEKSRSETLGLYESLGSYESPTLYTWTSTQGRLDPVAHGVLRLASFLAPEPIPVALFESSASSLNEVIDLLKQEEQYQAIEPAVGEADVRAALAELADWSMIDLEEESFAVHRLVQDAVRLTMPDEMQELWAEMSINVVREYIPSDLPPDDVRSWPVWTVVEPYVDSIINPFV